MSERKKRPERKQPVRSPGTVGLREDDARLEAVQMYIFNNDVQAACHCCLTTVRLNVEAHAAVL